MTPTSRNNINHVVIKGLSEMIVKIYSEWQRDTRHYKPTKKMYQERLAVVARAENLIDNSKPGYNKAVEAVEESKKMIKAVIVPRLRSGYCRVM